MARAILIVSASVDTRFFVSQWENQRASRLDSDNHCVIGPLLLARQRYATIVLVQLLRLGYPVVQGGCRMNKREYNFGKWKALIWLVCLASVLAVFSAAADSSAPPPTYQDIPYGPHASNKLDLWVVQSQDATPLLILIHGGGFSAGDKVESAKMYAETITAMMEAGISVAAINYRLTDGGINAYPIPMLDAARAVQFLRLRSGEYNLDPSRFAAMGGSAGGCILMWLGFHVDLAQPDCDDPALRQSSRLQALAPINAQSCLHLATLEKWFGVDNLTEHPGFRPLFGLPLNGKIAWTDALETAVLDASPITHLTADDPPTYLVYWLWNAPIDEESPANVWVHHPMFGIKVKETMDQIGLECYVQYPGSASVTSYASQLDFIIDNLTTP